SVEKDAHSGTEARARFKAIEKLNLVTLCTPIEKCDRLRRAIPNAPHLYIKRDDYLGFLCGGNKLRKLEYVMADVLRKRATTVITVGSIQSNHARVMAMVSRRLGLNCVLVLNGDMPERPTGNSYINSLLGVAIHTVKTRAQRDKTMDEVAKELEKKGERVYKVPLGASDDIGSLGLVGAFEEVSFQQKQLGVKFDAIIVASSSGGTQAGLEVGKRLFDMNDARVIGVSPDDPSEDIGRRVARAMEPMLSRLRLDSDMDRAQIEVDDRQIGTGYGI